MKNIIVGEYYRHKNTPTYCWAKVIEIIPCNIGINTCNYPIAKCEWSIDKDANFGLIKYFKLSDLIH
jgi:hypothetical protein